MEVITSHTNADFDTFASMIAAKKLYPEAHLVFSGSMETRLAKTLKVLSLPHAFERIKDIELDDITRLILVDARQAGRLGPFGAVAKRPGVELHIYDHHPETEDDLHGPLERVSPYGSCTTVLTLIIKERGLPLAPEEATLLMAGIYEDTGFLSFPSTTVEDFEAAAFLLSNGAVLARVSELLKKELTPDEVSLLDDFLKSGTTYTIGGVDVLVAGGYIERYSGDISVLAHKIVDIEGPGCLFMLVDSKDRVHVVARSRIEAVHAGRVMRALGGGGHAHAGSATIKGVTLIQARERLLSALKAHIVPARTASDIMSYPAITMAEETTLKEAVGLMRRYNINAAPVTRGGELAGVITRQVADKAVYHGLGASAVADLMTTGCESVSRKTSLEDIREMVIGHSSRLLPVLEDGRVVGVITRTDLMKMLGRDLRQSGPETGRGAGNLSKLMRERLPARVNAVLKEAGTVASELGARAYAVGGFVRDLITGIENLDVDIVVEGADAIAFAERYARKRKIKVRAHRRFKTAVLIFDDGFKVDAASARIEYYERPGALPTIEVSSLKLDLYRRDFIINTLALSLSPERFGELIDFFGAQKDIKDAIIRVIHNLSFVEDPTRMIRAVRFSEKFGFAIGAHTLNLLKNSLRNDPFRHVSGARLCAELRSVLEEDSAHKALKRLSDLGLLALLHKGLVWDESTERLFERARETLVWHRLNSASEQVERWLVLLLALSDALKAEEFRALARRLAISGKKRTAVVEARAKGLRTLARIEAGRIRTNSALYSALAPLPVETLLYLMARSKGEATREAVSSFISTLRHTKCSLGGTDLKRLGVAEGPKMGELLSLLLAGRLDKRLASRDDEVGFVRARLAREGKRRR